MKGFTLRSPDKPHGHGRTQASSLSTRWHSWQSAPVAKIMETRDGAPGKLQQTEKHGSNNKKKTPGRSGENNGTTAGKDSAR